MANTSQKKQNKGKGVSSVVAAVTGAVIGAGIGVAGAVLSDEKNRKKVGEMLAAAKDDAVELMQDMQAQAEVKRGQIEEKVNQGKDKVQALTSSAKKSLHRK